ncbi:hypothetical protein CJA_3142 [Cellvibrio japonicus Ueda107]|uniref:Uncharacterized protein n=1 Tax=Cellvibrio japonicus (strain Ueda107) TaxID=498211 RepID=B3PDT9_CELJU|nr:hypothetical protein CJA_3142 [Cellvibrio japonicus Ueda107]
MTKNQSIGSGFFMQEWWGFAPGKGRMTDKSQHLATLLLS